MKKLFLCVLKKLQEAAENSYVYMNFQQLHSSLNIVHTGYSFKINNT